MRCVDTLDWQHIFSAYQDTFIAKVALRSMASLCEGGRAAACDAALVRANANLASCTLTGGSGLGAICGEDPAAGGVAACWTAGFAESVCSPSMSPVM